jgi:hypothetical protein
MPNYADPNMINSQRNAITQALMGIANPPPPTSMPGQYGATAPPAAPSVTGPTVPAAGNPMMQPPPTAGGGMPMQGGVGGMPPGMGGVTGGAPLGPPQSMPIAPGGGRAGLPYGPVPKAPQIVGQPLDIQQPGSQITPAPPQGY